MRSLQLRYAGTAAVLFVLLVAPVASDEIGFRERAALGTSMFGVTVSPSFDLPVAGDGELFGVGGGAVVRGHTRLANLPMLYPHVELGYRYASVQADTGLHIASAGAGASARFDLTSRIAALSSLSSGYAHAFLLPTIFSEETEDAGSGYLDVSAGLVYEISPQIGVSAGAAYRNLFGLSQSLSVGAQLTFHLRSRSRPPFDLTGVELPTVYPTLYPHYAGEPPGFVDVRNAERFAASDVEVTLFVPGAMSEPSVLRQPGTVEPGESARFAIPLLMEDSVLLNAESQTLSASLSVSFTLHGNRETVIASVPVSLAIGNAIVWDDDRKAAAFVTHRSPEIMHFVSSVMAQTAGNGSAAVHGNLRAAMALYASIVEHGVVYTKDPEAPFTQAMREQLPEDHIRFPLQTLQSRAGDCDDLSVLYATLLEAVGIPAAFVTIPGHIYVAFSLGLTMDEARRFFADTDDLVEVDGEAWVPVEITDLSGGFLRAWSIGAAQWRRHSAEGNAALYPVRAAWMRYPPVAEVAGLASDAALRPASDIHVAYTREMQTLVSRELEPRARALRSRLMRNPDNATVRNRLAVLYARYGLLDEAETELLVLLEKSAYLPAMVNIGNVLYLQHRFEDALAYYADVLLSDPDNSHALLGFSRAHYATGDAGAGAQYFARLQSVNPGLAEQFAHLGSSSTATTRAAGVIDQVERMVWDDEDDE